MPIPSRLPCFESRLTPLFEGGEGVVFSLVELRDLAGIPYEDYLRGISALNSAPPATGDPDPDRDQNEPLYLTPEAEALAKEKEEQGLQDPDLARRAFLQLTDDDELAWSSPAGAFTLRQLQTIQKLMLAKAVVFEPMAPGTPPPPYTRPRRDPQAQDEYVWHQGLDQTEAGTGYRLPGRLRMKIPVKFLSVIPQPKD